MSQKAQKAMVVIEGVFCSVAVVILLSMTFFMGTEIISRSFFDRPLAGVYEFIYLGLPWVVFLPLAYTLRMRRHIRITILVNYLPPNIRRYVNIVGLFIGFAFFALVSWRLWFQAVESVAKREYIYGVVDFPMYPTVVVLFAGVLLFTVRFLIEGVSGLRRGRTTTESE